MSDNLRIEEQVISQAIELGISSQVESSEDLNVQVHTDLLQVVQGRADSVSVKARGIIVQPGIRVEEMELSTDRISVNPLSVLLGQIEFNQPIDAVARIVMTEADLNQALNSDYVYSKLFSVPLRVDGEAVPVEMQLPMAINLQTPGKIGFSGTILVDESVCEAGSASAKGEGLTTQSDGKRPICFSAIFCPRTDQQPALLEAFTCNSGHGISLPFAIGILHKGQELVESPHFELNNLAVRVKKMTIESGSLILEGEARVYQMPQI
jgi:hypothetical protein